MLLFVLVLGLFLTNHVSNASRGFIEAGFDFYDPLFTSSFDWRLLQEISLQQKNVLVSPISLKLILGLLYQGTSQSTDKEFHSVLNFENRNAVRSNFSNILAALQNSGRSEYLLNIGTSIFVDKDVGIQLPFEQVARQDFRTDIKSTNFGMPEEASKSINEWISQLTHGKVTKMVTPDDLVQTLMLISNAIYFKGTWLHPFPKNQTFVEKFMTTEHIQANKPPKYVHYMTTLDEFFYYDDKYLKAKILRLEYKGSSYAMYIILPNTPGDLESLIKKITLDQISNVRFNMHEELVDVTIPKFKFNFGVKLAPILKKFGLTQIFQNTDSFSGIVATNNNVKSQLTVSDIVQKTGIEVDEEGSVVFSATDINISNKFGENKLVFNATHPFMFFIEGPNGTILFAGKYEDPDVMESTHIPNKEPLANMIPTGNLSLNTTKPPVPKENCLLCLIYDLFSFDEIFKFKHAGNTNNQQISNDQSNKNGANNGNGAFVSPIHGNFPNRYNGNGNVAFQNDDQHQLLSPNLDPDSYQLPDVSDMDDVVHRFNLFDIELLNTFGDNPNNVLISPASIKTTLAMILEGAVGHCAVEIGEALRIPTNLNEKGVRNIVVELLSNLNEKVSPQTFVESHNAIFVSDKVRVQNNYKNIISRYYNAHSQSLDFGNSENAANVINKWSSDSTHGAINEVVTPQMISPESYIILTNALYFKGQWKTAFDKRSTSPKCFYTNNKGCVQVPMMHLSDTFGYNYLSVLRANLVDIPYQDKFSMLLIMPSQDTNIRSVLRDLPSYRLSYLLETLNKSEMILELPRFSFEYSVDLVEYLKFVKIRDIFGSSANLSKMVEGNNAVVNNLLHKTKIDVNEQGTEAAAISGAMIIPLMQPVTVSADRPFAFLIYHKQTHNILFEGIVQNPVEQETPSFYNGDSNSFNAPANKQRYSFRDRVRFNV